MLIIEIVFLILLFCFGAILGSFSCCHNYFLISAAKIIHICELYVRYSIFLPKPLYYFFQNWIITSQIGVRLGITNKSILCYIELDA